LLATLLAALLTTVLAALTAMLAALAWILRLLAWLLLAALLLTGLLLAALLALVRVLRILVLAHYFLPWNPAPADNAPITSTFRSVGTKGRRFIMSKALPPMFSQKQAMMRS
jgi:hypothetical protein